MTKKILYQIVKISVSCGLIFIIVRNINFIRLGGTLANSNKLLLVSAFVLAVFDNGLINGYKWREILSSYEINVPFKKVCSYYFIGMFFNLFMPSTIGGDLIRGHYMSRESDNKTMSYISVIIDRLSGLLGLLINSIIAVFLAYQFGIKTKAINLILILLFLSLFSLWLIYNRELWSRFKLLHVIFVRLKIEEVAKKIYEAIYAYKNKKKLAIYLIFLSFVFQFITVVVNYLVALALGVNVPFVYFWIFIPLICLVTMLPISINGIGLRDISYITCFATLGIPAASAFAISLAVLSIVIGMGLIGGLVYAAE
ncbi:MAG: flippase-like domain-containing protein [Candidatus Schekmanbacteria bacterium]|nr:flippase-like domain-containing protein [Candidatus Schekmanbacteria bacterium]